MTNVQKWDLFHNGRTIQSFYRKKISINCSALSNRNIIKLKKNIIFKNYQAFSTYHFNSILSIFDIDILE